MEFLYDKEPHDTFQLRSAKWRTSKCECQVLGSNGKLICPRSISLETRLYRWLSMRIVIATSIETASGLYFLVNKLRHHHHLVVSKKKKLIDIAIKEEQL